MTLAPIPIAKYEKRDGRPAGTKQDPPVELRRVLLLANVEAWPRRRPSDRRDRPEVPLLRERGHEPLHADAIPASGGDR